MNKLWACPKCKRKFEKRNQQHSCRVYPLKNHFAGKPRGKELFGVLINKLKKCLKFNIDSVECCIHLVNKSTFLGVFIFKDKIRLTLSSTQKINNPRVKKHFQMSANRHLHAIEIMHANEIDKELIGWVKEAYAMRK